MTVHLFEPIRLGGLTLANRITIAPMCQYSAEDGAATDWHRVHLGTLAQSGAGMLTLEATAVSPEGRISPRDLGLWSDATERALANALQTVRAHSTMPILIQLAHAGRKASTAVPWLGAGQLGDSAGGWQTFAPSAVPFESKERPPIALDAESLVEIREAFVEAAKRAVRIGLDGIELHAAHGYLLHQFLSPLSNRRTDSYGGALENRLRFPLEVFDAIRSAVPSQCPVGIRISASDWAEGGWDLEQSLVLAAAIKELGCDFIHVSSGGLTPAQKIPVGPGYQVRFAEAIKRESGLTTIAVGMITDAHQAETIIATGQADLIALARGILYDPRWPWHAAASLGATVQAAPQYLRCQPSGLRQLFG